MAARSNAPQNRRTHLNSFINFSPSAASFDKSFIPPAHASTHLTSNPDADAARIPMSAFSASRNHAGQALYSPKTAELILASEPLPKTPHNYQSSYGTRGLDAKAFGSPLQRPAPGMNAWSPTQPGQSTDVADAQQRLAAAEEWWTADPRFERIHRVASLPNSSAVGIQTATEAETRRTTTALFSYLHINLQDYLASPPPVEGSYFSYWGGVPEWCIDTSGGVNSFFGEDWGAPPERISRDARYRPLHRYGSSSKSSSRGYWYSH